MGFLGWGRRPKGRHALGAAVPSRTGRSGPPLVDPGTHSGWLPAPPDLRPASWRERTEDVRLVEVPVREEPFPQIAEPRSSAGTAPGRVQLGFRDGTTASLAADSQQAVALEELAQLLVRRD